MTIAPDYIGKFKVESILGRGGMGTVYLGLDEAISRSVAIKTIHPHLLDGEQGSLLLDRFRTEAMAAGKCTHNNIVTVYEYGEHQDIPFIAMEFVEGVELKKLMQKQKTFTLKQINQILQQVLRGLDSAHKNGIVHRDIKPANIIILNSGTVKLADFGIARVDTSDVTQLGDILGTPYYMSPEQSRGSEEVDKRSDIFSLGVVLYEMLSVCSDWPETMRTHKIRVILDLPQSRVLDYTQRFPATIAAFFEKCLAVDPAQRLASVSEFFKAYKSALNGVVRGQNVTVQTTIHPGGQSSRSDVERQWIEQRLAAIEDSAREYLGPLAGTIVQRNFEEHQNIRTVIDTVAESIPDAKERRAFLHQWLSSASSSSSRHTDGLGEPSGLNVDAEELQKISQLLAYFLGPIAEHLLQAKIPEAESVVHLVQILANEIPDADERAEFLQGAAH